jgi:peptidyl-tRNA hydrolase, PTH1 family
MAWRRGGARDARREPAAPVDLLVVGLGNPGADYARSRHNVGAETVDILAARHGARLRVEKGLHARADVVTIAGRRMALAVPQTYMNDSGMAVAPLVRRYGVAPEQLVIVQDELDLPPAVLKVKRGGGLAGHNGLRSIKAALKTDEFLRVRIGVGKPVAKERGADHVLTGFGKRERQAIDVTLQEAADAVECILAEGVEAAMTKFNARD